MIVGIFPIVVCGLLEIGDAGVNLAHRFDIISSLRPIAGSMLDEPTRRAQIRQGMQIGRVMGMTRVWPPR